MQRRFHLYMAVLGLCALLLLTPSLVRAQEGGGGGGGGSYGNDLSLFLGSTLPNQINGVPEIMPVFGGRYAWVNGIGALEFGAANTHATGVDFTTFDLSFRGEVPLAPELSGLVYGGMDFNWYIPQGATDRQTEWGLHVGGGAMMHVTDALWLRGDLKFMGGPGTALSIFFGFAFRPPSGGGGG